jgi:hypothetical protein
MGSQRFGVAIIQILVCPPVNSTSRNIIHQQACKMNHRACCTSSWSFTCWMLENSVKRCLAKIDELCRNSPTTSTPNLYFIIALMQAIKRSALSSYNYVYLGRNALGSVRWSFRGPNTLLRWLRWRHIFLEKRIFTLTITVS